jgi:hypothetical protein
VVRQHRVQERHCGGRQQQQEPGPEAQPPSASATEEYMNS